MNQYWAGLKNVSYSVTLVKTQLHKSLKNTYIDEPGPYSEYNPKDQCYKTFLHVIYEFS
jgi:hypothetical protein